MAARPSLLRGVPEEFLRTDDLVWLSAVDTEALDVPALIAAADGLCRRHRWRVGPGGAIGVDEPKRSCILRAAGSAGRREVDSGLQAEEKTRHDWAALPEVWELGRQLYEMLAEDAGEAGAVDAPGDDPGFDYVLVNLYGPGDRLGWHADREAGDTAIVSVSLGAAREFGVRRRRPPTARRLDFAPAAGAGAGAGGSPLPLATQVAGGRAARQSGRGPYAATYLTLEDGDVVVMRPGAQGRMEHEVRPGRAGDGPRLNLTFRRD